MMPGMNVKYLLIMTVRHSLSVPNLEVTPLHGATMYEEMITGIIAQIVL